MIKEQITPKGDGNFQKIQKLHQSNLQLKNR